jgi:hypothetical protein
MNPNTNDMNNLRLYNQVMGTNITKGGTSIADLQRNQGNYDTHVRVDENSDDIIDTKSDKKNIHKLVSNINDSLDNIKPKKKKTKKKEDTDTETIEDVPKPSYKKIIFDKIKEPLLLLFIYFLLSQGFVKNLFGMYFKQINPNDDGQVSIFGILIYGTILTIIFMISKHFL